MSLSLRRILENVPVYGEKNCVPFIPQHTVGIVVPQNADEICVAVLF
jgi:hypothetical protein